MIQDKRVHAMSPAADAVALRMADHEEVKSLFARYDRLVIDGAAGESRHELAESICVALTVHITAEEELFHPAALGAIGAQDVLREATAAHLGARHLIADIVNMTPVDPLLDATVKALGQRVERHMRQQEEGLIPKLRAAGLDLGVLGARIAERKSELRAEMEEVEA